MSELYNVSASPHVRSKDSTRSIMADVAIALIPAGLFGIYNFGLNALLLILVSVATCILTEYIYQKKMGKSITIGDCSALVTGLLLAYNMPSTIPLWIPIVGGVFAIIIVKQLFGGVGQNFMNPALAARCFLLISFSKIMTTFGIAADNTVKGIIMNGHAAISGYSMVDGVSGATILSAVKTGGEYNILSMFIGTIGGTIGETSVIAILIGAIYLLRKRIIALTIPLVYIGSFILFIILMKLMGGNGFDIEYIIANIFGGGLMLGAFFMATDYVTCPITPKGKIIFGVSLGLITAVFRVYGSSAEGVSYAIILCNLISPLIEKYTLPKAFGREETLNA
ncbi:RnfABCDGE type electron transport complex subunit D [Clostridium sp.]|uniref:RnfABCDGE type electron transport complex subunit D n=1 Tax=Clostridium sp. TaxID=1506 RepID=UPI002625C02E|nr:RnfABCDGE type electron transport complex subunit D [Clostridium sp.]